jgi:hypothetical protein
MTRRLVFHLDTIDRVGFKNTTPAEMGKKQLWRRRLVGLFLHDMFFQILRPVISRWVQGI